MTGLDLDAIAGRLEEIVRLPASQIRVEVLLQAAKLRNMADARAQAAD